MNQSSKSIAKRAAPLNETDSLEVPGLHTVLVIESDPVFRNLLRDIFCRNGNIVLDAVGLAEARKLLQGLSDVEVDVLIVASDVPDLGEIGEKILSLRPSMKVLLTDRRGDANRVTDHLTITGAAVLREPFTETRLIEEINALLRPSTQ